MKRKKKEKKNYFQIILAIHRNEKFDSVALLAGIPLRVFEVKF